MGTINMFNLLMFFISFYVINSVQGNVNGCGLNKCFVPGKKCLTIEEVCNTVKYFYLCDQLCRNSSKEIEKENIYPKKCNASTKEVNFKELFYLKSNISALCIRHRIVKAKEKFHLVLEYEMEDTVSCIVGTKFARHKATIDKISEPKLTRHANKLYGAITFDYAYLEASGRYKCIYQDNNVRATDEFEIFVFKEAAPSFVPKFEERRSRIKVGSNISISCNSEGHPTPKIVWMKDGKTLKRGSHLLIRNVKVKDSGNYTCLASHKYDKGSRYVIITVFATERPFWIYVLIGGCSCLVIIIIVIIICCKICCGKKKQKNVSRNNNQDSQESTELTSKHPVDA